MNITETFEVSIYTSGPIEVIKQACRSFCYENPLCVTVERVDYLYAGGEEAGARIGVRNYPRFPKDKFELEELAFELARIVREEAKQHSTMVVSPGKTVWVSDREERHD